MKLIKITSRATGQTVLIPYEAIGLIIQHEDGSEVRYRVGGANFSIKCNETLGGVLSPKNTGTQPPEPNPEDKPVQAPEVPSTKFSTEAEVCVSGLRKANHNVFELTAPVALSSQIGNCSEPYFTVRSIWGELLELRFKFDGTVAISKTGEDVPCLHRPGSVLLYVKGSSSYAMRMEKPGCRFCKDDNTSQYMVVSFSKGTFWLTNVQTGGGLAITVVKSSPVKYRMFGKNRRTMKSITFGYLANLIENP